MLNSWLRICRYWYNRQLGERFDWWERNRTGSIGMKN
ncbi:helix-turn-helix domain-containing protein [Pleurocapsa sp. PCC 7319]